MCFVWISVQTYYLYRFSLLKESSWKRTVLAMTCIPANIEKCKTRVFVHAMRVEQRGRAERSKVPNGRGGVRGSTPGIKKKKKNCKWCNQSYSGALFVNYNPEQLRFFRSSWQLCDMSRR